MLSWLGYICGGLVGLFVLGLVFSTLYHYAHFRKTPAKRWRDQVRRLQAAALRRITFERGEMRRAGVTDEAEERALRDQAFYDFLTGISAQELDAYSGIGPATIAKLRDAGYTNLALLQSGPLRIPGVGGKRLKDVLHAIRDLVKQARSRFHAGACREAQELAARVDKLRESAGEEGFRAGARLRAVEAVLAELEPLMEMAQQITFIGYLNPTRIEVPSIPFVETELPDLERAIRTADEEAKNAFAQRNGQRSKSPPVQSTSGEIISEVASVHRLAAAAPAATHGLAPPPAQDLFRDMLAQSPADPAIQKPLPQSPSAALPSPSSVPSPARKASSPDEKPKPEAIRRERLAVLEIDPSIPLTADLVRRHFNLLAERYAAEKFASAGPEFVALAQSKREAILHAATSLLEAFGEKVEAAAPAAAEPQELRRNPDLDAVFGD